MILPKDGFALLTVNQLCVAISSLKVSILPTWVKIEGKFYKAYNLLLL